MTQTTTDDVRDALNNNLVEFDTYTLTSPEGVQVTVPESEIGNFWRTARQMDFEVNATRVGDYLMAHVEAEPSGGLGDLFR